MNRGAQAEQLAADYLQSRGMRVLFRNYHSRYGEIDLIAADDRYLAFVEVKCRAKGSLTGPLETVTRAKQKKIIQTAQCFLQQYPCELQPRFDVAAVTAEGETLSFKDLIYLENAFGL